MSKIPKLKLQIDLTPDVLQDIKQLFYPKDKFPEIKPVFSNSPTLGEILADKEHVETIQSKLKLKMLNTPKGTIRPGDIIVYSITNNSGCIGTVNNFNTDKIYLSNVLVIDIIGGLKVTRGTRYHCIPEEVDIILPKANDQTPKN